jgi:hypothetical protein
MTDQPSIPAEDRAAHREAVLQRQVALLEQLAEAGLRMALAIEGEATEAKAAGEPVRDDAAMTFSRVARAVRMTVMLQSKLIRDADEAQTRAAVDPLSEEAMIAAAEEAMRLDPEGHMHKLRVERIFDRVAKSACGDDEERIGRLVIEAGERLDDEDLYGDILERPVGELVALLCRDLGLDPDWSRLAEEAWAREEIASGALSSPFLRPLPVAAANGRGGPPAAERVVERAGGHDSRPDWFSGPLHPSG